MYEGIHSSKFLVDSPSPMCNPDPGKDNDGEPGEKKEPRLPVKKVRTSEEGRGVSCM